MRRAFTFVEFIVVIAILGILSAVIFPVFNRTNFNESRSTCQSKLRKLGIGFMNYAQDYDGKLPLLRINSKVGWPVSIRPYIQQWQTFHCPIGNGMPQKRSTDYFYNSRLAGLVKSKLPVPQSIIMNGDGQSNSSQGQTISQLPVKWLDDPKSPVYRHTDGANYLFADGHVKYLVPEKITLDSPQTAGNYTFLPR